MPRELLRSFRSKPDELSARERAMLHHHPVYSQTLAALVDAGTLRPILSQTFPLANGRAAFESAARPHPPGKTVLTVA